MIASCEGHIATILKVIFATLLSWGLFQSGCHKNLCKGWGKKMYFHCFFSWISLLCSMGLSWMLDPHTHLYTYTSGQQISKMAQPWSPSIANVMLRVGIISSTSHTKNIGRVLLEKQRVLTATNIYRKLCRLVWHIRSFEAGAVRLDKWKS